MPPTAGEHLVRAIAAALLATGGCERGATPRIATAPVPTATQPTPDPQKTPLETSAPSADAPRGPSDALDASSSIAAEVSPAASAVPAPSAPSPIVVGDPGPGGTWGMVLHSPGPSHPVGAMCPREDCNNGPARASCGGVPCRTELVRCDSLPSPPSTRVTIVLHSTAFSRAVLERALRRRLQTAIDSHPNDPRQARETCEAKARVGTDGQVIEAKIRRPGGGPGCEGPLMQHLFGEIESASFPANARGPFDLVLRIDVVPPEHRP
jgi:hypothetical protein